MAAIKSCIVSYGLWKSHSIETNIGCRHSKCLPNPYHSITVCFFGMAWGIFDKHYLCMWPLKFMHLIITICNDFFLTNLNKDNVIEWKHFQRHWSFLKGNHRSMVVSPHKGQLCPDLLFSLIWAWSNGWVNNWDASDLRDHHAHYDVSVMI